MKVYGQPGSVTTQRVLVTLAEKGIEAELISVEQGRGEQKAAEYMARHPFGTIPVLEDGEFTLCDSRAIMHYIDEKGRGPKLTPPSPADRGLMEQWMNVTDGHLSPLVLEIGMETVFGKLQGRTPDMDKVETAQKKLIPVLDMFERYLDGRQYFVDETLSLADLAILPYVQLLFTAGCGYLILSRTNLTAWWQRMSERPCWCKIRK